MFRAAPLYQPDERPVGPKLGLPASDGVSSVGLAVRSKTWVGMQGRSVAHQSCPGVARAPRPHTYLTPTSLPPLLLPSAVWVQWRPKRAERAAEKERVVSREQVSADPGMQGTAACVGASGEGAQPGGCD